jgi:hypothetical protein
LELVGSMITDRTSILVSLFTVVLVVGGAQASVRILRLRQRHRL